MRAATAIGLIEHVPHRARPARAITAPDPPPAPDDRGLSDNRVRYIAQSALTGLLMRDHGPAPVLPLHQAQDVVRWAYGAATPH